MKTGFALCEKGFENECALHLQSLGATTATAVIQGATFEVSSLEKLAEITYKAQGVQKVLCVLQSFLYSSEEQLLKDLESVDMSDWVDKNHSFRVCAQAQSLDTHEFSKQVGAFIHETYSAPVDLKNPCVTFVVYIIEDTAYFGVDMSGTLLSKREYRIFLRPNTLRATVAFHMLTAANYTKEKVLVDPFCGSGTIPIEATLFATNRSPHYYRKEDFAFREFKQLKHVDWNVWFEAIDKDITEKQAAVYGADIQAHAVDSTKKNAKIAGVVKQLQVYKGTVDRMDLKFTDEFIDCIVTAPPYFSNHRDDIAKVFEQLFLRAKQLLKPKGKVVLVTNNKEKLLPLIQKPFEVHETRQIHVGKTQLHLFVLVRL